MILNMTQEDEIGISITVKDTLVSISSGIHTITFPAAGTYYICAAAWLISGAYAISSATLSYSYSSATELSIADGIVKVSASAGGSATVTASNPSSYKGYFIISVAGHSGVSIS